MLKITLNLRAWPLVLMLLYQGDNVLDDIGHLAIKVEQSICAVFPCDRFMIHIQNSVRKCSCKNKFYSWSKTQKMNITGVQGNFACIWMNPLGVSESQNIKNQTFLSLL